MKRVFETAECEAVRNSIFWELKYEKHENQMEGCGVELRVSDSVCLSVCVCIFSYKSIVQYIDAQCEKYLQDETGLNHVSLSISLRLYVSLCLCVCVFSYKSIVQYIDTQYEKYLQDETGLNRRNIVDGRVHCCFYFINPSGHGSVSVSSSFQVFSVTYSNHM